MLGQTIWVSLEWSQPPMLFAEVVEFREMIRWLMQLLKPSCEIQLWILLVHLALGEPAIAVRLHLNLGSVANAAGDQEGQRHHLEQAIRLARSLGHTMDEGVAEVGLGSAMARQEALAEGLARIDRGVELLSHGAPGEARAYALMERGVACLWAGELGAAAEALDAAAVAAHGA